MTSSGRPADHATKGRLIVSATPILSRLRARVGGGRGVSAAADERIEIAPAEESESRAAIHLPGEIERVIAPRGETDLARIRPGPILHGPTVAYRVRDAMVADGSVYASGRYLDIAARRRRSLIAARAEPIEEAQLCIEMGTDLYFGRWLTDALAVELLAHERGLPVLSLDHPLRLHEAGYRDLLALHARIAPPLAWVDRLWLIDDRGLNSDHVRRLKVLRDRARAGARPTTAGPSHVFIARGQTGAPRTMVNADAVAAALAARGVAVIEPERMSPAEIVATLTGARVAIAVEGSALAHALLALPENGGLLCIQPPDRFNATHKVVGDLLGLRFALTVGEARGVGFYQDPERLLRTLDLLDRAVAG